MYTNQKVGGQPRKYLKANKSSFVSLLCAHGYKPTVRRSKLQKLFRARTWWLTWNQPEGEYEASISSAGGKPFMRIKGPKDLDKIITLDIGELEKLGMVEVKTA